VPVQATEPERRTEASRSEGDGDAGRNALTRRWRGASDRERLLQFVQPSLIGLIDGTVSTLAPIFAMAYAFGSRAALLAGLAASFGAAISMAASEGLSDDGKLTGRGSSLARGTLTGLATFVGGTVHTLPFLIADVGRALPVAYVVVAVELVLIAFVRKHYLKVSLVGSLAKVTFVGALVAGVGVWVGHA
jgi:VIT1/CCC1 family predicted Fe2+/Mn2+ transporter